jgi:hypothetical protein
MADGGRQSSRAVHVVRYMPAERSGLGALNNAIRVKLMRSDDVAVAIDVCICHTD